MSDSLSVVRAAPSVASLPHPPPRLVGRYAVYREIASGGMASVWLARQRGDGGFSRVVAIKQLFPHFAKNPEFVTMFRDEAQLVARIRHPNVVPTLDVAAVDGELILVMEYVAGESLSKLLAAARGRGEPVDPAIAVAVITDLLEGLHAAHQATNERGMPLLLVHRDVSPQNVIVGGDGVARVFDFGVAKAVGRSQKTTESGQIKGKVVYMPPEQVFGETVDRRSDIWAASVVLWEMLAGRQLFEEIADAIRFHAGSDDVELPSDCVEAAALRPVLHRGLARNPDDRFATARDMIVALERAIPRAPPRRVGQWVQKLARDTLRQRAEYVEELEAEAAKASMAAQLAAPSDGSETGSSSGVVVALPSSFGPSAQAAFTAPEPTGSTLASADVTPNPKGRSRRVLAMIGLSATMVAAAVPIMVATLLSRGAARGGIDDAAQSRLRVDASASGVETNTQRPAGSLAPTSTGTGSAALVPRGAASHPASTGRPNGKHGPSVTARPGSRPPAVLASPSSSDPLDPESRK